MIAAGVGSVTNQWVGQVGGMASVVVTGVAVWTVSPAAHSIGSFGSNLAPPAIPREWSHCAPHMDKNT
jgi:hypothetical protein